MGTALRLAAAACSATLLAACGGGTHTISHVASGTVSTSTGAQPPAQRAPAAYAARLLQDDELPGFLITDSSVYRTPGQFVSTEGLSATESNAELDMLGHDGFRMAAREDLDKSGQEGLSLVEQFSSPAKAGAALRFYLSRFRHLGPGAHYVGFRVPGMPGAVGFVLGQPGGTGTNIAFTDGDYYYLIGQVGSGPVVQASLAGAARSLYRRAGA